MKSRYPEGSPLRRAVESLRHEGFRTFAWKLASELGVRRILRLVRPIDEPIHDAIGSLPIAFDLLAADGIDEYLAARPDAGRTAIEAALKDGQQCFLVRHEGRIVSSCWSSTTSCRSSYLGREIVLLEGDVYFNDAWTAPSMRGHGLAHALCLHQLRHFRGLGFRRAVRGTIPENYSALRAHRKCGFRPVAMLACVRIGAWQREMDRPWRED
ncbi:MAG: GNAT family N-acetyltransferase [Betaproteobacteria bacterium]